MKAVLCGREHAHRRTASYRKDSRRKVYAGTINQKGSFSFIADKVGSETVLAHIIRMVQDAQGSKAPVQQLVDRIAAIFVPTILSIAVLSFLVWIWLDSSNGFTHACWPQSPSPSLPAPVH